MGGADPEGGIDDPLPPWAAPFTWAVVRLTTYQPGRDKPALLVFGSVSLLEPGRPRPRSGRFEHLPLRAGREGCLHFRRVVMRAEAALRWYRTTPPDPFLTPIPEEAGEREPGDGLPVAVGALHDPTTWPVLGFPIREDRLLGAEEPRTPFAEDSRVHRRFGEPGFDRKVVLDPDRSAWLARRVHVDLDNFPEYLGSLSVTAPDPQLRAVEHVPAGVGEPGVGEPMVLRLVPRRPGNLRGLTVEVAETRLGLLTRLDTMPVPENGLLTLQSPGRVGASGYTVRDEVGSLLQHMRPLHFLRSTGLEMESATRRIEINVPATDARDAPSEKSVVVEVQPFSKSVIGDTTIDLVAERITRAEGRRRARDLAAHLEQTMLEDRHAALAFVRERVAGARDSIFVADAYLGGLQVLQVIAHVARMAVHIRLLTSQKAFQHSLDDPPEESAALSLRKARFDGAVTMLRERGLRVDVRSMGRRPALHDRFLVVDGVVWSLGNSLNGLGSTMSVAIRLPDSESVIARLDRLMAKAHPVSAGIVAP